jgi:hypothetical protein
MLGPVATSPDTPAATDGPVAGARPAVVAVLTDAGRAKLAQVGKAAFVGELRAALLAAVDRVA